MQNWLEGLPLFLTAVLVHWQGVITGGIVVAVLGTFERVRGHNLSFLLYALILALSSLYSVFAAWQDEHRDTNTALMSKLAISSEVSTCKADLRGAQSSLRDKQSLSDSLQNALSAVQGPQAQQAANIASCINNLAKLNPAIHERITVVEIPLGYSAPNGNAMVTSSTPDRLFVTELVILTSERERHLRGDLNCVHDFKIKEGPAIKPYAASFTQNAQSPVQITGNHYKIVVDQSGTEWDTTHPAYLRVSSASEYLACSFVPEG